ncbi:hypothetical protein JAAARDRAFT_36094 [Jaapia argillacea MUCL 33604]|uniref:Uncharacterized protein n=1 Tax=Jaapia argillacea MUCL 33604 TaxID=933084 RepID=A0A067PP85_9AGAM|nr:hypothetical protein JAAARDRAFT_36094 [Jaapia argillacea MUCL 33604]
MTDIAPVESQLVEASIGHEEKRLDPHSSVTTPRASISNGVYVIRSSFKANLCLQLNTDDNDSITASAKDTAYENLYQQWLLTRQTDNTYKITNRGRALEMAAVIKSSGGSPGYVVGSSEDFFWMLNGLKDGFVIGDSNAAYVVDLSSGGTSSRRPVSLNLFDPEDRLEKQLWHFDLLDGTAPDALIIPGYSYSFINLSTGRVLGLTGTTPYMYPAGIGIPWYATWLPIFDVNGNLYITTTYPRGSPATSLGYLSNGSSSTTPVVSRLKFADPVFDGTFYIIPNSDVSGDVVADNSLANNYASFEPLDTSKLTQKWRMKRIIQ